MATRFLMLALVLVLVAGVVPKISSMLRGYQDDTIAQSRVEHAVKEGLTVLEFGDLKNLTSIPDSVRQVEGLWFLKATGAKRLTNIDALKGLPDLRHLQLGDTRISSLAPLSDLKSLEVLDIRTTWVTDLEPLTTIPRLRWIQMNELGVKSLCPLNEVRALSWLNLYKSYAKDGSTECFHDLERTVTELGGGSSYKQGYVPGTPYLMKVSMERWLEVLEWR